MASLAELIAKQRAAAPAPAPAPVPQPAPEPQVQETVTADQFNHPSQADAMAVEAVAQISEHIGLLRASFENPEAVLGATRQILLFLNENPQFVDLLQPADFGAMVSAMRQCAGIQQSVKVTSESKKSSKRAASQELQNMLSDALSGLNF